MSAETVDSPREIIDRRTVARELNDAIGDGPSGSLSRKAVLEALQKAMAHGDQVIAERFRTREDWGLASVAERSYLIDQILRILFDYASSRLFKRGIQTEGEKVALVAVGGYGRSELAPKSDVDLLFLLPYKLPASTEQLVEFMLYTLWDLGLTVGHATRSIDENLRHCKDDVTIRTSMLDARWVWGDQPLFKTFMDRFKNEIVNGTGLSFVDAKLRERAARHERLGDSRYVLEPNVKEDKGGLRDLHTLRWITKYLYGTDDFNALADQGVIRPDEARMFERAYRFLTTVRCHIQYKTGRADNRLTFDLQKHIANAMGYAADRPGASEIERFMKHYYLTAREIGDLSRIVLATVEEEHRRSPFLQLPKQLRQKNLEGFVVEGAHISVANENVFDRAPIKLIEIFSVAQENNLKIHPSTLTIITRRSRDVVALRDHAEANAIFLDILTSRHDPEPILRRMSECGVFGRFIPDFGRVVAQMQYDMYHVYTTDEHTVRAIGILHKIEQGNLREELPIASDIVKKVQSRRALYVAVMLHDIAKGRGGDHSVLGAEIAEELCPRLGLTDEETETVSWLVRYHLLMSHTAFKRDLDDPKTLEDFTAIIQSPERLKLLLVLTCADIRAVGPNVWNGWKATLLRELYWRADERLTGGRNTLSVPVRVQRGKDDLAAALAYEPSSIQSVLNDVILEINTPSYWLTYDTPDHVRHVRLIDDATRSENAVAIHTHSDPDRAVTELIIYTHDHPGLFAAICGALSLSEASIVDAKIETLPNGMALDTFTVQGVMNDAIKSDQKLKRIAKRIESAVYGELRLKDELKARSKQEDSRLSAFEVPPRVIIDNTASNVHSVIEVNGQDRTGFLYDVARALRDTGLQLSSAHITTYGERVVDVFYVKDVFGMKITHEGKIRQVRAALQQAITQETDTHPGAPVPPVRVAAA